MASHIDFPDVVVNALESRFGQLTDVKSLSGIAGSGASIIRFREKSVIVKSSPNPRERIFYEQYARRFREHGVNIAETYWSGQDSCNMNWIAIEAIPHVFPQEQWINNSTQLRILFNLHSCSWGSPLLDEEDIWYRPKWDDEVTQLAHTWYKGTARSQEVRSLLLNAQQQCQRLFVPHCSLSGDPNPTNWRVREDGSLVLIDWERFCCGSPAIDLAITMPNLGSKDLSLETLIARSYIGLWQEAHNDVLSSENDLAFLIHLGKIWTVVEFIANAVREPENYPKATVEYIVSELPDALNNIKQQ